MPCSISGCNYTVITGHKCGCRVRYSYCGICPDGQFWYSQIKYHKPYNRKSFIPGQSHGGHNFVPGCYKH